jgi:hypothetical protein
MGWPKNAANPGLRDVAALRLLEILELSAAEWIAGLELLIERRREGNSDFTLSQDLPKQEILDISQRKSLTGGLKRTNPFFLKPHSFPRCQNGRAIYRKSKGCPRLFPQPEPRPAGESPGSL